MIFSRRLFSIALLFCLFQQFLNARQDTQTRWPLKSELIPFLLRPVSPPVVFTARNFTSLISKPPRNASGKILVNRPESLVNEGGTAETDTAHRLINCLTAISFSRSLFSSEFPSRGEAIVADFTRRIISAPRTSVTPDVDVMRPGSV